MSEQQTGYRAHAWDGELHWERFARGTPGEGEVLVEVAACGIGLTVLNYLGGNLGTDPGLLPRVPGHELVGRVAQAGPGVDPALVGRQAVAYFYLSCGVCGPCLRGDEPRCRSLGGWVGTHRDGGYAPWTVLPARSLVPIPDDLDPVAATVVPDALATPVHVCHRRARIVPGDRVAVIGAGGGVGMHMVQVARLCGGAVVGLDLTDTKLAALDDLGVDAIDATDLDAIDPARLATGRPDVVIDLVGDARTLGWGAAALDGGGRLVVVTTVRQGSLELVPRDLVFREIAVLGSRYAQRAEIDVAAALVRSGQVRPIIGATVDPPGLPGVHEQLRTGTLVGRGAVRWTH